MPTLRLNPKLDVPALAKSYQENRRVRVEELLDEKGAWALHSYLEQHDQWWQLINSREGLIELDRKTRG